MHGFALQSWSRHPPAVVPAESEGATATGECPDLAGWSKAGGGPARRLGFAAA
jgi:hypothetical protein